MRALEAVNIISKINELKEKIMVRREEIIKINQGEIAPQALPQIVGLQVPSSAPTLGKKLCHSCGKESEENTCFCPECGANLDENLGFY